ncbi:hypothetical protein MLD38_002565 [Melastoma candidum]|uniref:Uncharacterized protein n=1 Tax=Melastoma candidum TaxID=119954 RepID=A0ACB9S1P4_9MYRT|nr:hypothetical protein MLD38_002565 [Melastoma candidum]
MGDVEVPIWLKSLPLAPVFRPTDTEFVDPIAYISKIEKEASAFGICKIVPPLPRPSKKYVFGNLNKSLAKCPDILNSRNSRSAKGGLGERGGDGEVRAVFTTRHQELGQSQNVKKAKGAGNNTNNSPQLGVHKQVWQSGEVYTLEQFEAKARVFAKSQLGILKDRSPEAIEALFWQAASDKSIYVEYANDVPGSAFGEQDHELKYFNKRRRSRTSYHRCSEELECRKDEAINVIEQVSAENKDASHANESSALPDASDVVMSPLEKKPLGRRDKCNSGDEIEGMAGWKLSNSPWNLQVIARSPGSLTRFMPDDIPGVTSPMVYIGMLFSWFAWHVEDHELHSMNFLHTGAPKTWYSVPGDYAYAFEEVIQKEVYGGNVDRLAALTFLGEKTTLLSPEIIVAAGIPCCRLVQHPGEFVVTFPRAYHIGFSHGFNCGEAANFATPQWIRFAKEAAVRRAAMNYLPMLSHQQLLYLLTMSFVSRVPRSLFPGARSSRMRDRQREERELLVKKAFLDDISYHNDLLLSLLEKNSSLRLIIWNPDLLPSLSEHSLVCEEGSLSGTQKGISAQQCSDSENNSINLFKEMTLYMEAHNGTYLDKDDLLFDFQVDSKTVPCVACGILGFPFMAVMHPSPAESEEHLQAEQTSQAIHESVSVHVPSSGQEHMDLIADNGSSLDTNALRPWIFCLEHAIEIKDLLEHKGEANLVIICHSDYQKMKVYANTIAEEIGVPFKYKEIPMDNASEEDLNLIDLAIANEQRGSVSKDWTSSLGVNLRYCMKVRKNSTSRQVQHTLALGRLFSSESPSSSSLSSIKWKSRKSRSRYRVDYLEDRKRIEVQVNHEEKVCVGVKKEERIIQYARRNAKTKSNSAKTINDEDQLKKHGLLEASSATDRENIKSITDEVGHEIQVLEVMGNVGMNILPGNAGSSLSEVSSFVGNVDVEIVSGTIDDTASEQGALSLCQLEVNELPIRSVGKDGNSIGRDPCSPMVNDRLVDEDTDPIDTVDSNAGKGADIQRDMPALSESATSVCQVLMETPLIEAAKAACDKSSSTSLEKEIEVEERAATTRETYSESSSSGRDKAPLIGAINSEACKEANSLCPVDLGRTLVSEKDEPMTSMSEECTVANSEAILDNHRPDNESSGFDRGCSQAQIESCIAGQQINEGQTSSYGKCLSRSAIPKGKKRRSEVEYLCNSGMSMGDFIRSPCEGLRPRIRRDMV